MSDLVDKTPEVLIKTVNHDIGFPRRHIYPILGYVASRLFSSASDGGLAADKILTKDFNPCDKSVEYQTMISHSLNLIYLLTLQLPLKVTSLNANSLLTSFTMCFHIKGLEN